MSNNEILGIGVYTLQEAALYGKIAPQKLSRWIFGNNQGLPVIESQLSNDRLISFYDLIQSMAVERARSVGIPLTKIREAILIAKTDYNIDLPLAYEQHELWWFDKDLHIHFPDDTVVQVTGKNKGQQAWSQIVEPFKQNLRFDTKGLVQQYIPLKRYERQIVFDPTKQFGQPLVDNTGYRVDVLYEAFMAERSYDIVAHSFGVDNKDVKIAVEYMKSIRDAA